MQSDSNSSELGQNDRPADAFVDSGVSPPLQAGPRTAVSPFSRQVLVAPDSLNEGALDPHRLAKAILMKRGTSGGELTWRNWNGGMYRWVDGRYEEMSDDLAKHLLTGHLKDYFTSQERQAGHRDRQATAVTPALVNKVLGALESIVLVDGGDLPMWLSPTDGDGVAQHRPDGVETFAFLNGLLRMDAASGNVLGFEPPSPLWFSRVCYPHHYRPEATCDLWEQFVAKVLPAADDRRLLQEMFGYCLVPDTSMQKFFLLEGRGSNGKSVTTNVLAELLGPNNVSSVPLEEFGDSFGLETTVGKLANIVSEINDPSKIPEGIVKKVVGGEHITINRKHLRAIQVKPTARLIVTTNELPQFRDQSDGMSRRLVPLRFGVCIPIEQQDPHLVDKLCLELPGIFRWAVEGLKRLRARGQFELTEASQAMVEEMRPDLPSAQQFLRVACEADPNGWVSTEALYSAYLAWCGDFSVRPDARSRFGQKIGWEFKGAEQRREPSGRRAYGYGGIRFKDTPYRPKVE